MITRIHLLGRFLIEFGDSAIEERDLPERTGRLAFAYIAMERHRLIPAEDLAQVLWPNERPEDWERSLEAVVSKVRALLDRPEFGVSNAIRTTSGGYEMQLGDVWIDAEVAIRRVEEARSALKQGQAEKARRAAATAADITSRSFLPGEDGSWIDRQRDRFRQANVAALEILDESTERTDARSPTGRAIRTLMFTDIVDSTRMIELVGDDAWSDLVKWHDQALRRLFDSYEGEEVDHAGDGFFVAFSHQQRALECAVAIQHMLVDQRKEQGFAPQVRIGLHTAEVNADQGVYKGKGVHEAARIAALAGGGEIVASRDTVKDLEESQVEDARTVELKNVTQPVEVVTLAWD